MSIFWLIFSISWIFHSFFPFLSSGVRTLLEHDITQKSNAHQWLSWIGDGFIFTLNTLSPACSSKLSNPWNSLFAYSNYINNGFKHILIINFNSSFKVKNYLLQNTPLNYVFNTHIFSTFFFSSNSKFCYRFLRYLSEFSGVKFQGRANCRPERAIKKKTQR